MATCLRERRPIAAKQHRCEWCAEPILKGERHYHYTGLFEGDFQSWRLHSECEEAIIGTETATEGFSFGEGVRGKNEVR